MKYGNDELKVMRYIYDHGTITGREASHNLNIERLGARVFDLRQKGIPIEKFIAKSETGKRHAIYFITEEWISSHDRP